MSKRTFSRFKYAEKHARDLLRAGHLFAITMRPDAYHLEDGEDYVYDEFVVEDLGPR